MNKEPISFIHHQTTHEKAKKNKVLFFIVLILLLYGVGCAGKALFGKKAPQDPLAYDPVTLEPKRPKGFIQKITHFVFHDELVLEGQKKDRINILLLGQGGIGHDGPFLTDTIILGSIKPSTKQIAMVAIPRDLEVDIKGHGKKKVNHANAFGEVEEYNSGIYLAKKTIEETFNVDINYVIRADFKAFKDIIDNVNGVTVNVTKGFVDTQYPTENYEYQTISFAKGPQTMDGETALKYVRSRHGTGGEGSDFARSRRQRQVILALKEKMLSFNTLANPIKINDILESLKKHVLTNMTFSDIITMLKLGKDLDTSNITVITLDSSEDGFLENGYTEFGEFVLQPKSGNYKQITAIIKNIFSPQMDNNPEEYLPVEHIVTTVPKQIAPKISFSDASIEIQNGTWNAGLAARIQKRLKTKSFSVTKIGNSQERPLAKTVIYTAREDIPLHITEQLKKELQVETLFPLPPAQSASSTTDILVTLGEDFIE